MNATPVASERPLRADARRNHERILAAARVMFGEHGLAVPIDEVARQAGVGAGTIYRHFPSKEALYEAILMEDLGKITSRARSMAASSAGRDDPGGTLFTLLVEVAEVGVAKMQLAESLAASGVDIKARAAPLFKELHDAINDLLVRAQRRGDARADVGTDLLMALLSISCKTALAMGVAERGRADLRTLVGVILDGLRAPA